VCLLKWKTPYAPEYIDDLDQAKINWSLRTDYARASAWALGRETDQRIITALDATTNSVDASSINGTPSSANQLVLQSVTTISEMLNDADVPADMLRYAVVNPATLSELLQITGATSSDFAMQKLLTTGREPAFWMGFNWMVHTGIPAGTKGFFYHMPSVGHGVVKDITTSVDWIAEKVSWLVNSWMSDGAIIIDETGVIELADA